jgi:hypothetical protein
MKRWLPVLLGLWSASSAFALATAPKPFPQPEISTPYLVDDRNPTGYAQVLRSGTSLATRW